MPGVAIVTGAAHGIGRACVERLCCEGFRVVATDVDVPVLQNVVGEMRADGLAVEARELDVSNVAAGQSLVNTLRNEYGGVDALVNNGGYTERVDVEHLNSTLWRRMLAVHVRGPAFLTQAVARDLISRGSQGAIVNVSSIRAETAEPSQTHYCAAKGALRTMTRAIAQELAAYQIRVNCVGAGLTETRMTASSRSDPESIAHHRSRVPLGRYAQPAEIAACVAFLLSERASFITGTTLYADGNYLAV